MRKSVLSLAVITAFTFASCGSQETKEVATTEATTEEVVTEEVTEEPNETTEENSFYGSYTLTDMVAQPGDKELKDQDIEYITQSKERTINNTTLTINEDGTFERIFPHPSGDGTTKTWTGTYEMNEESSTITFNVELGETTKAMEFTVIENTGSTLSVSTSFGQIGMNYIYTK